MLKVRSFKSTGDHRPFLSKFDVKLGSWGMINTGDHRPLEVSTKPLQLPPPRGPAQDLHDEREARLRMGWGWTEYQKSSSIFVIL